jgi:hypothetical protein
MNKTNYNIKMTVTKKDVEDKYRLVVGTNLYLGPDDSEWVLIDQDDKYVTFGKASNKDTDLIQYFN